MLKKKGHLARVCRGTPANTEAPRNRKQQRQQPNSHPPAVPSKKDTKTTKTHHLDAGSDEDEYNLFTVTSSTNKPLTVTLNGANLNMEIDTGAARSVISDKTFKNRHQKIDTKILNLVTFQPLNHTAIIG